MPKGVYPRKPRQRRVGYIVDSNGCWCWQNANDGHGYGHIRVNGKNVKVYRYYYEKKYGAIPQGLELDHLCKNKICCNPDHLEAVTHQVNSQRAVGKHADKIGSIRRLAAKLSGAEIARVLNIPRRTVYSIIQRSRWANL